MKVPVPNHKIIIAEGTKYHWQQQFLALPRLDDTRFNQLAMTEILTILSKLSIYIVAQCSYIAYCSYVFLVHLLTRHQMTSQFLLWLLLKVLVLTQLLCAGCEFSVEFLGWVACGLLLELHLDLVFWFGIGWYFSSILPTDTIRSRNQGDIDGTSRIVLPCPSSQINFHLINP